MRTITVQCRLPGGEWQFLNHFTAEHTQISAIVGESAREDGYARLSAHAKRAADAWRDNRPQADACEIRAFDSVEL